VRIMASLPQFTLQETEPLFPKIMFNRPVTRQAAGRLLLVGGHASQFSLPTSIHQLAVASGIGECSVVLPENLAKILGGAPGTYFVPSSPSGSLGRGALGRILELSEEVDAVAIGASLSNNSDTAMLTERLLTEIKRPLILFDDALKAAQHNIAQITENPEALVILTMAEVFKLCGQLRIPISIRPSAGLINKLEIIQDLKAASRCSYVVFGTEIVVAADTNFVVTPVNYRLSLNPSVFYATLGTFWLQNPTDRRAGLATGAYLIHAATSSIGDTNRPATADIAEAISSILKQDDF
jgi:NAD(P)H-hydrate repair Nnr-like enzyme with NAD(P)H-hydrate dehydratase domain